MLQTVQIIGLLQGIFILFILFVNRKEYKKTTFWLLFGSLLSVSFYIIGDDQNNMFAKNIDWFFFDSSLFVTFLFLFFKYDKSRNEQFARVDYFFFLPNCFYLIAEIIEIRSVNGNLLVEIFEIFTELIFLGYLVSILYSIVVGKRKHWIVYFAIPIVFLFLISFVNDILKVLGLQELQFLNDQHFNIYLLFVFTFLFYFIAFRLLSQGNDILPKSEINKYKNSNLSLEQISKYRTDLVDSMERDKLYLNGKLSIQIVSEKLNIPRQYISEVLNEHMDISFQDFINRYRVEEFINRLKADQNNRFTLFGIATDVGFNSKSSFNAIFKKFKGLTPSQYKNNL